MPYPVTSISPQCLLGCIEAPGRKTQTALREDEMNNPATLTVILALTSGAAATLADNRPVLTLRVVNEGGVDPKPLALAKKEATRVLAHSGIDLIWLNCESGRSVWRSADPCNRTRGPAEYWIRIVTRRPRTTAGDMLGFTELDESTNAGSAGIYYPAAEDAARRWRVRVGDILGAAIAHEVGHLLLGANAHTATGIMQPNWDRPQFTLIGISELDFTARQGRQLRDRIAAVAARER
jgi:hypothetical protein